MATPQTDLQVTVGNVYTAAQLRQMVADNAAIVARDAAREYPQGRAPFVNNRMLERVPFMIVSHWMERHQDARVFDSGKSYPAHQVMQVWVRTLNADTFELFDPELATLSGEYLLNQFRNATPNELQNGGPWTLRPHPVLNMAKYGKPDVHPLMLALWHPVKDRVEVDGSGVLASSFGMGSSPNGVPEKVAERGFYTLEEASARRSENGVLVTFSDELRARGLTETQFLEYTGWSTVGGHSNEQIRTAFALIDRMLQLTTVASGTDVASATESLKQPRKRS